MFHHFHIISSHPHWFSAQQSVGQQRPLKSRQEATLAAVQSWKWKSACNNYGRFLDLSAEHLIQEKKEKKNQQDAQSQYSGWKMKEEKKEICEKFFFVSPTIPIIVITADVSLKGRKCKIDLDSKIVICGSNWQ